MKKYFFITVLGIFLVSPSCFALSATANEVSVSLLKRWLSHEYSCKIDNDGDLVVNHSDQGKVFITVYTEKKFLRIRSGFSAYNKCSRAEMIYLANEFNRTKGLISVYIMPDSRSFCEYYMWYDGGLNSANLIESVKCFIGGKLAWQNFVTTYKNKK